MAEPEPTPEVSYPPPPGAKPGSPEWKEWKANRPPPVVPPGFTCRDGVYYNKDGRRVCGARRVDGINLCCNPMIDKDNFRCKCHGGTSQKGVLCPGFKDGRYSKYVPRGLHEAYVRAEADPDLLSLRADVALLQALQAKAMESMEKVNAPPWEEAAKKATNFQKLMAPYQLPAAEAHALDLLVKCLNKGADAARAWRKGCEELKDLIQRKTHTASAEHKRMQEQGLVMTVDQAAAWVGALIAGAREIVKPVDETLYKQLMKRTQMLLPGSGTADQARGPLMTPMTPAEPGKIVDAPPKDARKADATVE